MNDRNRFVAEKYVGDLHSIKRNFLATTEISHVYTRASHETAQPSRGIFSPLIEKFNMAFILQNPPSDPCIVLQVGERRFRTTAETLSNATYFDSRVSGRWESNRSSDGSYFVDADPALFEHILRYLRREQLPIFYNASQSGFDYALYSALQGEATFFGIERLRRWIEEKGYLNAVKIKYSVMEIHGTGVASSHDAVIDGDAERSYHPSWGTEQVYKCPRGVPVHDGNPNACGRQFWRDLSCGTRYLADFDCGKEGCFQRPE